jgi:hypothetical protein
MMSVRIAVALAVLSAGVAHAQAWLAPRGETTVSLAFQRTELEGHLLPDGRRIDVGGSHSRTLALQIEHSLTDRLAFECSIPYVASANGVDPQPVLGRTGIDDGNYHSTWQDLRLGVRYNIVSDPVLITPSLVYRAPTHDYPTIGEAAVGPGLREIEAGVDLGRAFTVAELPSYADLRYSRAFVEKFEGVPMNRANAEAAVGVFVHPRVSVRGVAFWQNTYGGLSATDIFGPTGPPQPNPDLAPSLFLHHDRLLRDNFFRWGAGASLALTQSWSVSATFVDLARGTNSHYGYAYSLVVSRSFPGKSEISNIEP